jgi:separase
VKYSKKEFTVSKRPHLVLILDKNMQQFSLESMPCLRGNSVSRMPSFTALMNLLPKHVEKIDSSSLSFLLNPSGDLINTQSVFQDILESYNLNFNTRNPKWSGQISSTPSEPQLLSFLESNVFLYFGHGGGEMYARGHAIRNLKHCAVTILMGCSSGKLALAGEFDPHGTALNYLIGGCGCLVAVLWDVTDRDIDRFGKRFMEEVGLVGEGEESVGMGVVEGREACQLKYLVGAAPVVYGLPVWFIT